MTRFARAKGSKSSNERAPEDSTPWEVMKEQLLQAKKESDFSKKREEAEKQRIENYENFLKEHKSQKRKAVWCDFPEAEGNKATKPLELAPKKKKQRQDNTTTLPGQVIKASIEKNDSSVSLNKKTKKKKQKQKSEVISPDTECNLNGTDTLETAAAIEENLSLDSPNKKKNKKKKKQKLDALQVEQSKNEDHDDQPDVKKPIKKNKKNKKLNLASDETSPVQDNYNNASAEQNTNKPNQNGRQKNKKVKQLVDGVPLRRKPIDDRSFQLIINGKEVELVRFDGFPIMKRDAERLSELKSNMIKKGIPKSEVNRTLKLERRRAEKALARLKRDVCYNCRKGGHNLSDCPELKTKIPGVGAPDGVCFKCGSTEHRQFECKVQRDKEYRFATCFICKEPGHIARQCPDNPKGLYPNGGGCKLCGDVTHLRKDCPTIMGKKEETSIKLQTLDSTDNLEGIEQKPLMNPASQDTAKKPKKIKF